MVVVMTKSPSYGGLNKQSIKNFIKMIRYKIIIQISVLLAVTASLFSCEEEPATKFDIVESPVLAIFEGQSFAADDAVEVRAQFFELDKSGILDNNIGIDSTAISGLNIELYIFETTKIADFVTDGDGVAMLQTDWNELGVASGVTRLEWVGVYNDQPFRIFHNIAFE